MGNITSTSANAPLVNTQQIQQPAAKAELGKSTLEKFGDTKLGTFYKDSPVFENLSPGIYTAWVKDKNGCGITSKKFYVLNYPRYFTPNGDGINDSWFIKNINVFPKSEISIFDRYGKLLYQFSGINKGWDGKFNSVDLPSSDYWFVINIGNTKIIKGHFTLKR